MNEATSLKKTKFLSMSEDNIPVLNEATTFEYTEPESNQLLKNIELVKTKSIVEKSSSRP
jgi:hypothetical protein